MAEKKGGMGACDGGGVLFQLKNIRSHKEKIAWIEESMKACAQSSVKKARKSGNMPKAKRGMSGYNCYMKECAKKTGDFKGCLTAKGWSGLTEEKKAEYNKMAAEGCNVG